MIFVEVQTVRNKLAILFPLDNKYLRDGVGVKIVIVGQLSRRMQFASSQNFNIFVFQTIKHLKRQAEPLCGIYIWGHREF